MAEAGITTFIQEAVARIAGIVPPAGADDIYAAGFASTDALELLVELEDRFGVVIPDERFITARSIDDLAALVESLPQETPG